MYRSILWSAPLLAAAIALAPTWKAAEASPLFVAGSTFQVQANNSPDTFTDNVTLTPGSYSLDGGALNLTFSIVPTGSGGAEWLVFDYTTTSGGPLSQPTDDWALNQVGLDAAVAVNFIAAYSEWSDSGTVLTPTENIFGGYGIETNPVPGQSGTGLGVSGIVDPLAAGPAASLGAFISPWSYLNNAGFNSADVNGYEQALEFEPQTPIPTPEPTSLALLSAGVLGLALYRRRRAA